MKKMVRAMSLDDGSVVSTASAKDAALDVAGIGLQVSAGRAW